MNLYIRTDRDGHLTSGTIAVVEAWSQEEAQTVLDMELKMLGLAKDKREGPYAFQQLNSGASHAIVLRR